VLALDWYVFVLRLLHIGFGVAWGGSLVLFVLFLQPTAAAVGPAAGPFMGELLGRRKLPDQILRFAGVTILAGLLLYWKDWHDFGSFGDWVSSPFGLGLTIGGASAIVAVVIGLLGTRPKAQQLMSLTAQVAQSEGPPPPELAAQIGPLQDQLKVLARLNLVFVGIAVLAMSTARYW
jgi:hypothetical protein